MNEPFAPPVVQPTFVVANQPRNGLGIAALCLGVAGIIVGLIPLFFVVAWALGATGFILALFGRGRVKRGEANNRGVNRAGLLTSILAVGLGVIGFVIVNAAFEQLEDDINCVDQAQTAAEMDACN